MSAAFSGSSSTSTNGTTNGVNAGRAGTATPLRHYIDVAVIGAGVIGLAVTDALIRRGVDVVCFDHRKPGQGQSGGLSRTFRTRHDSPHVVKLAADSRVLWREWERRSGKTLVGDEGTVYLGFEEEDAHGLRVNDVPHRFAAPAERAQLFSALGPVEGRLLHDPDSGAIRARNTIDALTGFTAGRIRPTEVHTVTVPADGDGVELQTADEIIRARHVVIAAGTNTPRLAAGVGIDIPLNCALHARPHYRIRNEHLANSQPCWVDKSGAFGETVYGSPIGTTGRYVFGLIGTGVDVPMDGNGAVPPGSAMEDHVRRVSEYVRRAMPGIDPEPVGVRVCVMTKLPGGSDAFGVWQNGGVTAVTGHNLFKLAPVLGEKIADAAVHERVPAEIVEATATAPA
ncbi:hypothetical protein GCM10010470_08950 [Saccharopolyspora taberi]|uniref:FAD dependent oxidoreductase domain-containing protein n=2 Tax=Saccharopolyspora taberi TaxID=60895 RepID=A0ABN3V5A9_9PSEU